MWPLPYIFKRKLVEMMPFRLEKTLEEQCESKHMNQVEKVIKEAALHQGRRRPYSSPGAAASLLLCMWGWKLGGWRAWPTIRKALD